VREKCPPHRGGGY